MFETIPQGVLQACIAFDIWTVGDADISKDDVYWSIATAIINSMVQIIKLKLESRACDEKFLTYSLECLMARIGWIPFQKQITKILDKSQHLGLGTQSAADKTINYNIKYGLPFNLSKWNFCTCLSKYKASLDFDFSTLTIQLINSCFFVSVFASLSLLCYVFQKLLCLSVCV